VAPAGSTGVGALPQGATPGGVVPAAVPNGPTGAGAIAGYRMIGSDMSAFLGQRVTVTGTLVPPTAPAGASGSATGATGGASILMPEFHVVSVQPATGQCPERH